MLLDGQLLVLASLGDLFLDGLVVRRGGHAPDTQTAARLVDQVDGLVRQVPVGYVAVSQVGGGHDGLVGDRDPVVRLVAVPQPLQYLDGVGERRLLHLDGLEAPLQGSVLLQVLAVLVERRGPDGLELATGQHRLQDGGGIDGPLCRSRAHQGVQLIDEQDNVAPGPDLLEHLLQALFEIAPVARPSHQGAEVERVELLAPQGLGDVAGDDALGQALDDGRLADARFPDEHGVVLSAARQHLHDPFDLAFAPDHGVELVLPGQLGEVAPELVQHGAAGRDIGRARSGPGYGLLRPRGLVTREQLDHLLAHPGEVGPQADKDLSSYAFAFANKPEEHVLGAYVVVPQLERLPEGKLEHLLGPGRERR